MKFRKIFTSEFSYQIRSISTQLYFFILVALTILMNALTTPGDGIYANNTFHLTSVVVIGGFLWLVMGATVAGEAAARDVQTRMHPLIFSTPTTKLQYLGGRFLAAFATNALLMLSLTLGVLVSFYLPFLNEGNLLPFNAWPYLSVFLLIGLPNAFVATSLQFAFASMSRHVMTSYFASFVLAIFPQLIALTAANLFENWDLVILLDPVGVAGIIGNELQTWTPIEKNTRLVTLEGMFLWNRLLWLSVASIMLIFNYVRFHVGVPTSERWRLFRKRRIANANRPEEDFVIAGSTSISLPNLVRTFNFNTALHQTLRIALTSFKTVARNPAGLTIVAAIALISALFGHRIISQLGIPLIPTTQQVLSYFTAPVGKIDTPMAVIPLLIMYFSGVLIWRDRDARTGDIADASPVPEWALLVGKIAGMALIIFTWMVLLLTGGILMQIILGHDRFQLGLYLQVLFGIQLVNYLLFAILAIAIHVIANQKYVGYLLVFLVFMFIAFPSAFGVEHTMLVFGADPGWTYTDMRGFGNTLGPWIWFKLYWIAWALLIAVAARLMWVRGREQSLKTRLYSASGNFTKSTRKVTMAATLLVVIFGSYIFYNTNVLNEYHTNNDLVAKKAQYELKYSKYRNAVQPQLHGTKLHIEIFPMQKRVEIRGTYKLVNDQQVAIDSIHLGNGSGTPIDDIRISHAAELVVADRELSHYIFKLKDPLEPLDSLEFTFVVTHEPRGFRDRSPEMLVVDHGTAFTNYDLLPAIGYQQHREIDHEVVRKQNKLPHRPAIPSLYNQKALTKPMATDQNTLEVIVGTAANETAVAPGILHRTWTEKGRNYFQYKTNAPIGNEFAIFSGNYSMKKNSWNDVEIRIYHHPDHPVNVNRILQSAKASLDYFTAQYGSYPYKTLTIVERAGNGAGASADASMINYGEQYSLMNPDDSPTGFDLPFYILAHEMAHQWWGVTRLTPAYVEGGGVLIEGLAVYSGMQVLEEAYGSHHLHGYVNLLHSTYEMPRSLATPSLLQANESFLYYRKGGLAMHTLSKYIGKQKVNLALRTLLRKRSAGEIKLPTSLDLFHEIKQVTPDSLAYLLRDFFETNTYWRLKTRKFAAAQTPTGAWEVTMTIQTGKFIVDSAGREVDVPMNDWLEVGIYENNDGQTKPLYLKMHRIQSGDQTVKITVPRKPQYGGIDPNHLTIDLRRDDNVMFLNED
jgi:ABC-2 type transport system permease protein